MRPDYGKPCPQRGQPGEKNAAAKLRASDVLLIRRANEACRYLAKIFGVAPSTISAAKRGDTWQTLFEKNEKWPRRYISAEAFPLFCRGWPVSCHRRKLGLCDGDEEYETYEALARTPLVPLGHVRKAN